MHSSKIRPALAAAIIAALPWWAHPAQAMASCSPVPCIKKDRLISPTGYGRALLAVDPADPRRLVVGTQERAAACPSMLAVQVSADRGDTWQRACLPTDDDWYVHATEGPAPVVTLDGAIVVAGVYDQDGGGQGLAGHRSIDGGTTWSEFQWAGSGGYYRGLARSAHASIDLAPHSAYRGTIYVPYTAQGTEDPYSRIAMAVSRDGGLSWGELAPTPEYDALAPGKNLVDLSSLAIERDGRLQLLYAHCRAGFQACTDAPAALLLTSSRDGGQTWSPPRKLAELAGMAASGRDRPMIVADASAGPRKGRLYIVATAVVDGHRQLSVSHSDDGGRAWTAPVPVSAGAGSADQFSPWATVDSKGTLTVTWMDSRAFPDGGGFRPMVALSTDGGASFSAAAPLDTSRQKHQDYFGAAGLVSHAWAGDRLRAAFVGPNADGTAGVRVGRASR